jgi:hypothetical protein
MLNERVADGFTITLLGEVDFAMGKLGTVHSFTIPYPPNAKPT